MTDVTKLVAACRAELEEARRQIGFFGEGGVRAQLQMPDQSIEDITDSVVRHQQQMVVLFDRLIAALEH